MAAAVFSAHAQSADAMAPPHWRFGVQFGAAQDHGKSEPTGQISLAYDLDRTWSVEALANISLIFVRDGDLQAGQREFDSAVGARVLGTLPLGDRWSLVGGLGVVQVESDIGNNLIYAGNEHEYKTSALVSAAAMYRLGRRWSIGVEAASYPQAHAFNTALRAEFHF